MKPPPTLIVLPLVVLLLLVSGVLLIQKIHIQDELDRERSNFSERESNLMSEMTALKKQYQEDVTRLKEQAKNGMTSRSISNIPATPKVQPAKDDFVSQVEQDQINDAVRQKYDMVLKVLNLSADQEESLLRILVERERILNMVSHSYYTDPLESEMALLEREEKLADLDKQVHYLMDSEHFEQFEILKDSGFEHFQLREFDSSLDSDNFLSEPQVQAVLMAKLQYKNEYQRAIKYANELIKAGKKEDGFKAFDDAVENYKSRYLIEAQSQLNSEQFEKLKQFEEKNFKEMLLSLKAPYEDRAFD